MKATENTDYKVKDIGLAEVGKQWGAQTRQLFNTPPTVEVFSGTSMGILFTQDLTSID